MPLTALGHGSPGASTIEYKYTDIIKNLANGSLLHIYIIRYIYKAMRSGENRLLESSRLVEA